MPEEIIENTEQAPDEVDGKLPEDTAVETDDVQEDIPAEVTADESNLPPGMTEEGLRKFLSARHAREISADMRLHDHYARLVRQAEELKAQYPGFDLASEMRNPVFARLTAPGVDIDPGTAYEIVHRHSIREADRFAGLQRAAEAVRSGSLRPAESALSGVHAPAPVRTDPRNLSPDDRRDIRRRVERGERVMF